MQFFRRHPTLVGLCAVLAPLLVLVALQYQALSRLEETSPAARRLSLESRLHAVADELDRDMLADQRRALEVGPQAIIVDEEDDDVSVFRTAPGAGVTRYFLASLMSGKRRSKVTTYDPATGTFHDNWDSSEFWAAFSASFHLLNVMMEKRIVDPTVVETDEKDAAHRIAVRPIVDDGGRIVGVAGMIVDQCYIANSYLPGALGAALRNHFSQSELSEMDVVVYDETGSVRYSSGSTARAAAALEVSVPLPFVFSKWKLGLSPHGPSQAQVARRYFVLNLTLTILMMVILASAVVLSLRAAARELRLSEMKTDFVSNVSHELRTPLASIRVFGELMKNGRVLDSDKVHEYGELIESESRRLSRLVDNILDFSKIESGRKVYEAEAVDPATLVGDAVGAFAPLARQAGFDVEYDPPDEPLPAVRVDEAAMSQAVMNLLDNATKYSGGSRHVVVALAAEPNSVAISVSDNGIGIPADEQARIFNRFHRVSSSLVHDVKGAGLGLALVKHVAEAHGGSVTVRSWPGEGSTFTIRIPADPAPQGPDDSHVHVEKTA